MTEDITPTVLRQIREDIAGMRERMESEFTDVRSEMRAGFAHTNEQLGAVVALMGRLAKSDEHLEARIEAFEAHLSERR